MKLSLLSVALMLLFSLSISAQTVWETKSTIDALTGNNPYTIASGLIDNDTDLDILIGTDADHIIVWYKGNGDGTFVKQTAITNSLTNIVGIKLVDLDSDTDLDILAVGFGSYAAGYGTPSALVWFQNDGSGNFGSEQLITNAFDGMSGLFAGTIDAGSTIDVAVTSVVDGEVFWLSNDGSGNFSVPTNSSIDNTLNAPGVINMKDIDGDGDLDAVVATANYSSDAIEIFRNDLVPGGTVLFTKDAASVTTGKIGIFNANFEDLDGDSNLDILATEVSCGTCSPSTGNLYWYEDNGSGFTETVFTTSINNPAVAQFKDVDNDGLNDIILSSGTAGAGNDLVWFKNNGSGSFGSETVIDDTQSQAFVYTINDFDDDGDNDIASCAYNQDDLNYFENLLESLNVDDIELIDFRIYPNPTTELLYFEGLNVSEIDVTITDILGKTIAIKAHNPSFPLNVSKLAKGLYTLKINDEFVTKFIKN
ncbi:T9SS type A sorting domain-containing protein [Winogradskyella tangerina]|uniref:T9SS type A sorting domain-containing protein n=1 Tax=Winogradskyella tangerina TaxID=2023240 RepID=UPI000DBE17A4|nr:T9SS type A sorting domain-containing protein [Winogradskyella tangerina]